MGRVTSRRRVVRVVDGASGRRARQGGGTARDQVHREVAVRDHAHAGDDFDPAAGFLVGEGVVRSSTDISAIRYST